MLQCNGVQNIETAEPLNQQPTLYSSKSPTTDLRHQFILCVCTGCAVLCCAVRFFKILFSPSSLTIYYYHAFFVTHTSSFLELWFSMRSFSRPHTYTLYYKVPSSNASISGEMAKIQLCVSGTRRRPRLSAEVDQSIRSLDYKEAQQREVWPSAQNERRKITEL